MNSSIFAYDVAEDNNQVVLFGRQNGKTISWKISGIPYHVLYLELQPDFVKSKQMISNKEIIDFIPFLSECQMQFTNEIEYKKVCPIVSFQCLNSDDDVPNCWDDEHHKKIFIEELNLEEISPIHKSKECIIPVLKISIFNQCAKLKNFHMNHSKLQKMFKTTNVFVRFWKQTLSIMEQFCLEKKFKTSSWIQCLKNPIKIENEELKETSCAEEYSVMFNDLILMPENKHEENFSVAFMDFRQLQNNQMELGISLNSWTPERIPQKNSKSFKFIFNPNSSSSSSNSYKLVKNFGNAVNDFFQLNDVNIIIPYRWHHWMQKQFAKFKINVGRLKNNTASLAGTICYDAAKCFEDRDLYPRLASYQLNHMAKELLKESFPVRLLNPMDRIDIIEKLFLQYNTINILHGCARVCGAPWQFSCELHFYKLSEWILLHKFYESQFIIRQIAATKGTMVSMTTESSFSLSVELKQQSQQQQQQQQQQQKQQQHHEGETLFNFDDRGGLTIEPEKGVHPFVLQVDFVNDYPSIIIAANFCFSRLTITSLNQISPDNIQLYYFQQYAELAKLCNNNLDLMINNMACIPSICADLKRQRMKLKDELKNEKFQEKNRVLSVECNIKVLKLTLNTLYGCLGFPQWRFYCPALQEYIAATGRLKLSKTKSKIDQEGFLDFQMKVVAGDTDSLLIKAGKDMIQEAWDEKLDQINVKKMNGLLYDMGQQIVFKINSEFPGLTLSLDGVYAVFAPLRKKKYLAIPFLSNDDFEISNCIWKGMSLVKFNESPFINNIRAQIMMEIAFFLTLVQCKKKDNVQQQENHSNKAHFAMLKAQFKTEPDLKFELLNRIKKHIRILFEKMILNQMNPEDFVIAGKFEKPLHSYPIENAPPQVQVARFLKFLHNHNDSDGEILFPGDSVEMIVCYDFTKGDNQQYFPAHMVIENPQTFKINNEFYLKKLIETVHECLHSFEIGGKEKMEIYIRELFSHLCNQYSNNVR